MKKLFFNIFFIASIISAESNISALSDEKISIIQKIDEAVAQGKMQYNSLGLYFALTADYYLCSRNLIIGKDQKFPHFTEIDSFGRDNFYDLIVEHFIIHGCDIQEKIDIDQLMKIKSMYGFDDEEYMQFVNNVSSKNPYKSLMSFLIIIDSREWTERRIKALLNNGFKVNTQEQLDILEFANECIYFNAKRTSMSYNLYRLGIFYDLCDESAKIIFLEKYPLLKDVFDPKIRPKEIVEYNLNALHDARIPVIQKIDKVVEQGIVQYNSLYLTDVLVYGPYMCADIQLDYDSIIKHFVKKGCDIHQKFDYIKLLQTKYASTYTIEFMTEYFNKSHQYRSSYITIMHYLIERDDSTKIVQALLDNGFKVDANEQFDILEFEYENIIRSYLGRPNPEELPSPGEVLTEEDLANGRNFLFYNTVNLCESFVLFYKSCDQQVKIDFLEKYPELKKVFTQDQSVSLLQKGRTIFCKLLKKIY